MATCLTILIRLKVLTPPSQLKPVKATSWVGQGPRLARALSLSLRNLHLGDWHRQAQALHYYYYCNYTLPPNPPPTTPPPLSFSLSAPPAAVNDSSQGPLVRPHGTTPSHGADLTLETASFHDRQLLTITTTNTNHESTTVSAEARSFRVRTTQRSPLPRLLFSPTTFTSFHGCTQNTRTRTSREVSHCTRSRRHLVNRSGITHGRDATSQAYHITSPGPVSHHRQHDATDNCIHVLRSNHTTDRGNYHYYHNCLSPSTHHEPTEEPHGT